jgi:hypothetical protein
MHGCLRLVCRDFRCSEPVAISCKKRGFSVLFPHGPTAPCTWSSRCTAPQLGADVGDQVAVAFSSKANASSPASEARWCK